MLTSSPAGLASIHPRGRTRYTTHIDGLDGQWRVAELPSSIGGEKVTVVVARSLAARRDARPPRPGVLPRRAGGAALRRARRVRARRGGAAPGRGDAPPCGVDHRARARTPAARARRTRRGARARRDAQRHARPAGSRVRARATLPERREPRAQRRSPCSAPSSTWPCGGRARATSSSRPSIRRPRRPNG